MTDTPRRFRTPSPTSLLVILSAIAGTIAVVAVVAAILLWVRLDHQTTRVTGVVEQIQAERARNILGNCRDQNERHDDALAALDGLIAKLPAAQRARGRAGRDNTVLLLEALAPFRNCQRLLDAQVQGPRP